MASLNRVQLIGNLGKDPETKTFENGGSITNFSMATQESYFDKTKNERVNLPAQWHNIKIGIPGLGKVAQQYLRRGSQVYVEGSLQARSYEKDGVTRYVTEVNVTNMILLGGRSSETVSHNGPVQGSTPVDDGSGYQQPETNINPDDADDLPF